MRMRTSPRKRYDFGRGTGPQALTGYAAGRLGVSGRIEFVGALDTSIEATGPESHCRRVGRYPALASPRRGVHGS
jgi:hypothetical protein